MNYLIYKIKKFFKKNEFKEKIKKLKNGLNIKKKGLNYIFNYNGKKIIIRESLGNDRYFEMFFNTNKKTDEKKFCFLKNYDEIICEIPEFEDVIKYFIKRKYFDKNSFILWNKNKLFCYLPLKVLDDVNAIKMIIKTID